MNGSGMRRFDAHASAALVSALAGSLFTGCSDAPEPRPQLLIVVDTDLPVANQAPAVSPDATVDTLRVDLIADDGHVTDFLDVVAPSLQDWPVSFGVASADLPLGEARLRLRLFRGRDAGKGENAGTTTIEPPRATTVDRLVSLQLPRRGVMVVGVRLRGECLGAPTRFGERPTTCLRGERQSAELDGDLVALADGATLESQVGTFEPARERACQGVPPEGALCVPGGLSVLGDPALAGINPASLLEPAPVHPVVLTPFSMDRHEFSVGRYRALVRAGKVSGEPPTLWRPEPPYDACTYLGADDATNDALPLNCVSLAAAAALCEASGGSLPTEAQWEHAARGRGEARKFPWGDAAPECCSAALSRLEGSSIQHLGQCRGYGPTPVGSHAVQSGCDGPIDVSRDGVEDLAGNVREYTLDAAQDFSGPCWPLGLLVDPTCDVASTARIARGGSWPDGQALARGAFRHLTLESAISSTLGFRCIYEDER